MDRLVNEFYCLIQFLHEKCNVNAKNTSNSLFVISLLAYSLYSKSVFVISHDKRK